jgi:hypothetical protein
VGGAVNPQALEANALDEAYIDWHTRVTHRTQPRQDQRDLMEMSFFAGAALAFGVAETHGVETVMTAIKAHVVRLHAMSERYPSPEPPGWRERLHKRIDDRAREAHVYITWKAREIRRELGLPERPR